MYNPILGDWLILALLFLNCSRIFFLKYGKIDTLTVLAPICIVLSVLQIVAWGMYLYSFAILVISVLSFFINFRAFLRFNSGLFVDHYSVGFKFGAVLVMILTVAVGVLLVYFRPENVHPAKFSATIRKIRVSGDFTNGFSTSLPFEFAQGEIVVVEPEDIDGSKKQSVIIFPDKNAGLSDYMPLALILAKKGYFVFMGDFYARDGKWCHSVADFKFFRRAMLLHEKLFSTAHFEAQKQFYTFNMEKECAVMLEIVRQEKVRADGLFEPVYMIGDWMSEIALPEFISEHKEFVCGYSLLTDLEEYKMPGYGFLQASDPLLAFKFGFGRDSGLKNVNEIADEIEKMIPERKFPDPEPELETASDSEDAGAEIGNALMEISTDKKAGSSVVSEKN